MSLNSDGCMHGCLYMYPTVMFLHEQVSILMKVDSSSFFLYMLRSFQLM